jgi:hypothetical protein
MGFDKLMRRSIWYKPGELALSCKPSYLGGKSCGMARSVNTSVAHQMDFMVRTVAANVRQVA